MLIYFDHATKTEVLGRLAGVVERDGYLVLGGAETVVGLTEAFKPLPDRRSLYVPAGAATAERVVAFAKPSAGGLSAAGRRG